MKTFFIAITFIVGLLIGNIINVLSVDTKITEYQLDSNLKHTYYQHAIERQNEDLRMLINRMNAVEAT